MPTPFDDLPPTPTAHFALSLYAAALRVIVYVASLDGGEELLGHFPFLAGYISELERRGVRLAAGTAAADMDAQIAAWERRAAGHLPLRALSEAAGLDRSAVGMLLVAGIAEEESRFGPLFEALLGEPGQNRPTVALVGAICADSLDGAAARSVLHRLCELGLLQSANPDAPRAEWRLQPAPLVWDCLQGAPPAALPAWLSHTPLTDLPAPDALILPEPARLALERAPALLADGTASALVVRGPQRNGRRTLLAAAARALGRGALAVDGAAAADGDRWRLVGPLATVLGALPIMVCDIAPGELAWLPALSAYSGPAGVVVGRQGGLDGPLVERALALDLALPGLELRRRHWRAALPPGGPPTELDSLAAGMRLSSGNLRRAAAGACALAALDGRADVTPADVREARRALGRQTLETLTTYLPTAGDLGQLVASPEARRELDLLARRCLHRERLADAAAGPLAARPGPGVRALLSGPSGTGKTLAARLLAAEIERDLYRVDLAAVVNKYIGETEKNLERVLSCAEELDVVLLLDEGDALLTRRTSVNSSNDRYANLETNFLLQRLESFEGVLLITTNAGQRIDEAFQRRMDVVIEFCAPEPEERWQIWLAHLPLGHRVSGELLEEIAYGCALSGGQIRNAALYASLLALDAAALTDMHLEAAVQREYRKLGGVCPLRRQVPV